MLNVCWLNYLIWQKIITHLYCVYDVANDFSTCKFHSITHRTAREAIVTSYWPNQNNSFVMFVIYHNIHCLSLLLATLFLCAQTRVNFRLSRVSLITTRSGFKRIPICACISNLISECTLITVLQKNKWCLLSFRYVDSSHRWKP